MLQSSIYLLVHRTEFLAALSPTPESQKAAVLKVKRFEAPARARFIVFDHHIEDGDQLAHAGDHRDLERLAGLAQTRSERPNDRVAAHRRDRRHVQAGSHAESQKGVKSQKGVSRRKVSG